MGRILLIISFILTCAAGESQAAFVQSAFEQVLARGVSQAELDASLRFLQRQSAVLAPLYVLVGWLTGAWPPPWASMTLMFQREVAERIVAPHHFAAPPSKRSSSRGCFLQAPVSSTC